MAMSAMAQIVIEIQYTSSTYKLSHLENPVKLVWLRHFFTWHNETTLATGKRSTSSCCFVRWKTTNLPSDLRLGNLHQYSHRRNGLHQLQMCPGRSQFQGASCVNLQDNLGIGGMVVWTCQRLRKRLRFWNCLNCYLYLCMTFTRFGHLNMVKPSIVIGKVLLTCRSFEFFCMVSRETPVQASFTF